MKRALVTLFLILAILCVSCGRQKQQLHFVLCPKAINHPYWLQVKAGMTEAANRLGVKGEFLGPVQADVMAQVNILESLISRGVDGIAVTPNDPTGIKTVIDRAMDAGIPVLTFDSDSPESKRLCYVGTDNYQAGREAGKEMIRFQGKEGKYAIMTGGLGALNLNERISGFRDELQAQGANLVEVNILACNDDTEKALLQIEDLTRATPDLDAWYVTGGWAAVAPKRAFKNALNHRDDIVVISFDTLKEELLLVKEGAVNALIGQRPEEMGSRCIELLYDIVVNQRLPEKQIYDTGVDVVTQENVDEFLARFSD